MFSSRFVLVFFLLTIHIHVIHAQNDMPLLAQLQGEHNASHFGNKIISLDFNHDGFDDLVVYSMAYGYQYQQSPSRGKVYIYYGGPGFSSASEPAMTLEGDYPEGKQRKISSIINPGDVNGDGFDDLIIGDKKPEVPGSVRYLFYYGGTNDLSSPNRIECPLPGEIVYNMYKLGDIDGDGFGDVGICYHINYYTYFDIMWGGSFERQNILYLGFTSGAPEGSIIGIGDINNDGYHDFAIGYLGENEQYSTISVYYGDSSRVFSDNTLLIHTPYIITRRCKPLGDLNNDGFADFLGYVNSWGMHVWFGTSSGLSLNPNVSLNPVHYGNYQVRGINHGDFNGDGFSDVIGATYQGRRFAVWLGGVNMDGIADWQKVNTLENYGYDVAVGDFNADGYDDIAVSAPFEEGMWPHNDYRGYVFIYGGNPQMVTNDDPLAPQLAGQLQIRLSPNPVRTNGEITVSLSGLGKNRGMPITIEIFNIKGQVIHLTEINDVSSNELARSINLSDYTSGLYLCRVRTGGQATVKKFTILK
ncbi:MAG TPA: FG-GAP-like repeat-containing protein [Candidatus Cloacimonadota bacterium]|nr:FG-GAP-like repeat-containing protein [Candidatus Cloacimonadota bacterium]